MCSLVFMWGMWKLREMFGPYDPPTFITLQGGPFHGREIEDCGIVRIRMAISRPPHSTGCECGFAIYEPSEDRENAFWEGNVWDGVLA